MSYTKNTDNKKFKGHTDHTKLAAKPGDKIQQYINKKALELKLLKGNMQFQLKQLIKNKN
jgi:hypothetical protein